MARARRLAGRACAAVGRARAGLGERLVCRVHRRLRGARRRAATGPDRLGQGRCRAARHPGRPARAPTPAPVAAAAALACAATLVPVLLVWQLLPSASLPPPKGLRITFLDVGQGDSILLQVPEGAMLVDEGPPEANVAQQLRALGVRRLAAVVLTHQQRDHIGGAEAVLRRIAVDRVLDPYLARSSVYRHFALAEAEKHGVEVIKTRAGDTFRLGRLHLRVLWPNRPGTRERGSKPARDGHPRNLRRGRRAPDRRLRDRCHRAAPLTARRDPQGRAPRLGRRRARERAARAAAGGRGDLVRPRATTTVIRAPRPSRHCARAQGSASTAPTRTGASSSSRTASGSQSGRAVE